MRRSEEGLDHRSGSSGIGDDAMSALDRAAEQLAEIGASASADDEQGQVWAGWADHCWRLGVQPTLVDTTVLDTYIADYLDPSEAIALRAALPMDKP